MSGETGAEAIKARELSLQRALTAWIVAGLLFMLLPGTFLGVWNLIAIAGDHSAAQIDPVWIQAHGHAQIFGWIGTFILGIGFYSLSKMGRIPDFAVSRAWASCAFWTSGVVMRWATNLWQWHWRWLLPLSAILELAAFLLFFATVSRHRADGPQERAVWMALVGAGSVGFFAALTVNLGLAVERAVAGDGPAIPHDANQRLLVLLTWAFPVVMIWGFSARWLPVFLGLAESKDRLLLAGLAADVAAVGAAMAGWWKVAAAAFLTAAVLSALGLRVFERSERKAKTVGVHATFPLFVRLAFGWLVVSAVISLAAAFQDRSGGMGGASRHALTVGFISTMVFSIGQRVLPAFCGMHVLYSRSLMFAAAALLNTGCTLRVAAEIGAYEWRIGALWPVLPVSAVIEMSAVTIFAANLLLTFRQPPAHLAGTK